MINTIFIGYLRNISKTTLQSDFEAFGRRKCYSIFDAFFIYYIGKTYFLITSFGQNGDLISVHGVGRIIPNTFTNNL